MKLKQQSLALAIAAILGMSFSQLVLAQSDDQDAEELGTLEEVIVTGVRQSLMDATTMKRDAAQILDAVSAEDIGKLPDLNVAEALQRVTGVQIGRNDAGDGSSFQVRGLSQNNVEINGRELMGSTADNRTNSFNAVSSGQFKGIEVIKTPTADMTEGSLGATIRLKTFQPFDFKNQTIQYNVQGVDNSIAEDMGMYYQGLYANNWDTGNGRFGIVINASYEDKEVVTERIDWNWQAVNNYNQLNDLDESYSHTVFRPQGVNTERRPFYYETEALDTTIAWEPNDTLTFTFSATINNQERDRFQAKQVTPGTAGWQRLSNVTTMDFVRPASGQEYIDNGDGTYTPYTGDLTRTVILAGEFNGAPMRGAANYETVWTDQSIYGFNAEWTPGEWSIRFDAGFSDTEYDRYNINSANNMDQGVPNGALKTGFIFDHTVGGELGASLVPVFTDPTTSFNEMGNQGWNNFSARFDYNSVEQDAFKLDFTRNIDFMGFKVIDFGTRLATRQVYRTSDRFMNSGASLDGEKRFDVMEEMMPGIVTNFWGPIDPVFQGHSGETFRSWWSPIHRDREMWEAYMDVLSPDRVRYLDAGFPYDIEEETLAFYISGSFETQWGDTPVLGNVGVRYVQTDMTAVGRVNTDNLEDPGATAGMSCGTEIFENLNNGDTFVNCTATPDYSNWLPSFNINFGLKENLYLRVGMASVMARPNPGDMAPSISIPQGQSSSGTQGNPNLKPFEADQLDISLEWYIDEINTLSAALFFKDMENFITKQRTTYPGIRDNNDDGVIDVLDDVNITRPVNGGTGEVTGLEVAWQGILDGVTEKWWGGFGGVVNYTYTDSEQTNNEFNELTGETLPVQDLSEHSYNLILFYERYGFSARLAYNWRDESYNGQGGRRSDREGYYTIDEFGDYIRYQAYLPQFEDSYGQLDFSASYTFNPMFTIYMQGTNLTEELKTSWTGHPTMADNIASLGRTVRFGLRGRF